jgi:hypothetical protein
MGRVRRSSLAVLLVALALTLLAPAACSSNHASGLPVATSRDFADLDLIEQHARLEATNDGDAHPAGVAIVKSTLAAVFDHGARSDSARNREIYFVRIDGDFIDCATCRRPGSGTFGATRWVFFDWDPQRHGVLDFGYGSAPHLEEFGKVYAVNIG